MEPASADPQVQPTAGTSMLDRFRAGYKTTKRLLGAAVIIAAVVAVDVFDNTKVAVTALGFLTLFILEYLFTAEKLAALTGEVDRIRKATDETQALHGEVIENLNQAAERIKTIIQTHDKSQRPDKCEVKVIAATGTSLKLPC